MADIGGADALSLVGSIIIPTNAGPDGTNTVTSGITANSTQVGIDTNLNPVGAANRSTADLFASMERARIVLMDYLADNLR